MYNQEQWAAYREKNRQKINDYSLEYYYKNNLKDERRHYYQSRKDKMREYYRRHASKVRNKIIYLLGGKCLKCNFSDWRALQVDHVNGKGNQERKSRGHSPSTLYRRVAESVQNNLCLFQLLCANCNWIKRYTNNEMMRSIHE